MSKVSPEQVEQRYGLRLADNEEALQVYTRHWVVIVRTLSILVVLLLPAVLVALWILDPTPYSRLDAGFALPLAAYVIVVLLWFLYKFVDWINDALILTNQRLIHVERTLLFAHGQQEAALNRVQNVRSEVRGLVPTQLDYGLITVETAARGSDIRFGPTHHPQRTAREIMAEVQGLAEETSAQLMRQTLLHRLEPGQPEPPTDPRLSGLNDGQQTEGRFHLPFLPPNPIVSGDTITWRKHGYFLLLRLLRALLLLAVWLLAAYLFNRYKVSSFFWVLWGVSLLPGIVNLVVQYQLWRGDIYMITSDRLHDIYRTPFGLFGETRRSAPLERIQNITYSKPGLLANLLSFGDVRIQTAGADDLTFNRVPQPDKVQREIYRRQEVYRLLEQERQRREIVNWLAAYDDIHQGSPPKP